MNFYQSTDPALPPASSAFELTDAHLVACTETEFLSAQKTFQDAQPAPKFAPLEPTIDSDE